MNKNRTINILSTSRTAFILLLATLLTATTAQMARAQELTDFLPVSSSGTASGYFAFSDHFYKVDWIGINTAQTTSVQLNCNSQNGRLRAQRNGNTSNDISLHTNASTYWMASDITGLTPGQSSDGYTSFTDLSANVGTKGAKVCTVTCMAANAPTWNWSADYTTCTATFTCTASPSLTATVDATVTRSGSTATASATFNGTNYTDTKTIVTNYSITYVLNGGTNAAGNPTTYADNVGVASFANPTRTGYQFAGWYDNASFTSSPVTSIPAGSSGDKTLYAKWNIGLTYNTTGGYYEISNAQDLVVLANYVNDGNNASGMTFNQTQDIDMGSIGNFTPIGSQPNNYNPTPFNGTYDGQGHAITGLTVNTSSPYAGLFGYMQDGSVRNLTMVNPNVTSNDNSQGYKYAGGIVGDIQSSTIENCNVINPTLKTSSGNGYNNKGAICGGINGGYCVVTDCYFYTTGNVSAVGVNTLNVSVTASRTYALTLNDGITTSTAPAFSYGGIGYYVNGTTIALGGLSDRTGYTSDYAASGSVTVTDNQFAMPDGDVTVTAVYTPITYTITYHAGEGVDFSTEKNAYTVESAALTLDQPSPKTGYTFSGWYGNAGLTGDAFAAIATGSTGNVELWAKWTANTYTVHFVAGIPVNGEMADQSLTYGQAANLTANAFSTTKGSFVNWNTEADGSGTTYTDGQEVLNLTAEDGGVVTLYAQWHLRHRFYYNNTIFSCYNVDTPNQVYWAYAGETVKVEVIDATSEYTIRVVNGDDEAITLDTEANTFVMPNEEVWITYTSVKRMSYTTISLDNFESWEDVAYLYDANQPTVTPTVVVKYGENELTEGTDYTVEITNNTGSATQMVTATVTVTGMGGYVGTNTQEFRITPFNIANCEIKGTLEAYDDGYGPYYPLKRNVQVWNGDTQLEVGTDYTIELDPNIGIYDYVVGEQYQATIKGKGDWGGSQTFQFKVVELHHTVVFVANGGSGTMASDVATKGQHYILPPCGFTAPDGKKFSHWVASCEPDAEKQPGNYFTAPNIWSVDDVQTISVTAYWRDKATCTVTLPEEMEVVSGTLTDGKAIEDEVITFRPRPGLTATDVQANGTALTPDGEGIYTLTVTTDVTVTVGALAPIDWATVNQGDSEEDPYMIYNKDQLLLLAHRVNGTNGETAVENGYQGMYFKLGADIAFTHDANEGDEYDENYEAIGMFDGTNVRYFNGKFNGDGHTVSGIRIRKDGSGPADSYQGLFGLILSGADIHDVHLTDARFTGYQSVGGIVGYNDGGYIRGCTVTDSYITANANGNYGTICSYNDYGTLRNNYYHDCTVNGTAVTSGKGCQGADVTANHGALPAYAITLGANITTPPGTFVGQTEWLDTPPASPRLAPENGFTLAGNHYFASGYEFTPGSTLASGAAQGYTPRATLGGELLDPYTPTGDTDPLAGTAIARLTITADCDGKTLDAALRSSGQPVTVAYINADGTAGEASAIALDGTETSLAAGTYFAGLPTVQFDHKLTLTGDVTLILCDGCEMNVGESGSEVDGYGIICYANDTYYDLTICGQTAQTGTLSVYTTGPNNYAIGTHHITVNGGNVIAHTDGDGSSCGIDTKRSGNVTINSGSVSATTTSTDIFAWAISAAGNLTINGGNVSAKSNSQAIQADGNVAINGGTVNATGGDGGYSGIYSNGTAITLGWTDYTDRITASSIRVYDGTVAVADGKKLHNGSDYLDGTLGDPATAVNGKTLRPAATATYTTADGTAAQADAILLDGSDTSLPAGNYLATGTLNYTHGITLAGNVTLILADNCHMNVGTSGEGRINDRGIDGYDADPDNWYGLTITSESLGDDMGALSVYTTGTGNYGIWANALTINGGHVTSDTNGAAATALYATLNDLTINSGTVTATAAGTEAHAIAAAGNFNYNGGIVTATGGPDANAIWAYCNYTFSWRTPADRITIGATGLYAPAAKTATFTRLFTDATGNYYGATLTGTALNALKGVTLEAAETADFTVTLAPKGYGTYYDGHYDITLPAGTQARIVTARGATDGTLDYETIADGDDGITLPKTVPAGTAVMLCHDGGGSVTLTVNDADIDDRDFTKASGNTPGLVSLLHGSDVATETTGGTLYYKLTYGSATGHESIFGWYWGADDGAAFESPAHKAWLALPATSLARSFIGLPDSDDNTTGITTSNYTNDTNSAGAWYTLDGRKLDGTPMKSGIYVNNGKMVIIK